MFSRRLAASAFAGLIFLTGGIPLANAQSSTDSSSEPENNISQAHPEALELLGSDGKTRTTTPVDEAGIQGKRVELLPGDRLEVTEDGREAHIVNGDGVTSFSVVYL